MPFFFYVHICACMCVCVCVSMYISTVTRHSKRSNLRTKCILIEWKCDPSVICEMAWQTTRLFYSALLLLLSSECFSHVPGIDAVQIVHSLCCRRSQTRWRFQRTILDALHSAARQAETFLWQRSRPGHTSERPDSRGAPPKMAGPVIECWVHSIQVMSLPPKKEVPNLKEYSLTMS